MAVGQGDQPEFYAGVPLPDGWDGKPRWFQDGFKAGVRAAQDTARRTRTTVHTVAGQDEPRRVRSLADDLSLSAFEAVLEDRRDDALAEVRKLSGRDKAVLAYWVAELSGVLEDADMEVRRTRCLG